MKTVTFKSRNRSGRTWVAIFDMGSDEENGRAILDVAWKHCAEILSVNG